MFQASWRRVLVGVLGAVLLGLTGCGSTRSSTKVDEQWLARVPEAQLQDVRVAQSTQRKATDEVMRTKVALEDAKRARDVARQNEKAASQGQKAAKASLEAARTQGQGAAINQAQGALRGADLELATAQAESEYRDRAVKTLEALQDMRARELAVADAELAQQQYLALQRSGDVRAKELSGEDFAKAVADARSKAAKTQREVDALLQNERQARAQWQQLSNQTQAYGGSGAQAPSPTP